MASVNLEVPKEVLELFENIDTDTMLGEMTTEGAKQVIEVVKSNLKKSFKTDRSIIDGLKLSKVYKTPSDDSINTKVIITGYSKYHRNKTYPNGVPIPLIAMAREYGTSTGEKKRPFFRRSFNAKSIEEAMLKAQEKHLPKE